MEIVRTEQIGNVPWLNLFIRTYRHNDREGKWSFASRSDGQVKPQGHYDAVVIVPTVFGNGEPQLAVVREYRVPVGDYIFGFPAGLVEEGEDAEGVARRELQEETGLEVVEVTRVSPILFSSAGMTDESAVLVFVNARPSSDNKTDLGHGEEIELQLLTYSELCALCDSGARFDAKAWLVMHLFRMLGRLDVR